MVSPGPSLFIKEEAQKSVELIKKGLDAKTWIIDLSREIHRIPFDATTHFLDPEIITKKYVKTKRSFHLNHNKG